MTALRAALLVTVLMLSWTALCSAQTGIFAAAIRGGHEITLDEPTVVVEAVHDAWSETLILENE